MATMITVVLDAAAIAGVSGDVSRVIAVLDETSTAHV